VIKWIQKNKQLRKKIIQLEDQINLMKEHISKQNKDISEFKRKIHQLEMLLDIEQNTKRY
jgi:septal ring factor EnvC (AmiA/AmiB activator)